MNRVEQYLASRLGERVSAGNLRKLSTNRAAVDFFSNDYLGLSRNGVLNGEIGDTLYATGSTGSRLLSGNSREAEELEKTIARFHKAEAALLFNSGFDANTGLLPALCSRHTTLIYDELCHASIIDGARLSICKARHTFAHNDLADLEKKLAKAEDSEQIIVIAESVYSMDGDMAPLAELVALCDQYSAQLIVDEAHATGIFGAHGEGAVCAAGLQHKVFARVHTFGKALGCQGAAVVGSTLLHDYLVNFARSFIYTTALPGNALQAIANAYEYLSAPTFTTKPLHELITYFREKVKVSSAYTWIDSISPIQALITGNHRVARAICNELYYAGYQVNPILYPTVPLGSDRLRICLHMYNTPEQIDELFSIINCHVDPQ